jgi:hypothetical protein
VLLLRTFTDAEWRSGFAGVSGLDHGMQLARCLQCILLQSFTYSSLTVLF